MRWLVLFLALAAVSCGPKPLTMEEYQTQLVTFPNGKQVRAEVMIREEDMMRGMMFRNSLAAGRGMLFVHAQPGKYTYWMYQCLIPLDIIWMDTGHRIVEISANTPPCKTRASECPQYGGAYESRFVLEFAGGMAAKYGLKVGDTLEF